MSWAYKSFLIHFLQNDENTHKQKRKDGVFTYMDVSKNRGTPKLMVYNGKPY